MKSLRLDLDDTILEAAENNSRLSGYIDLSHAIHIYISYLSGKECTISEKQAAEINKDIEEMELLLKEKPVESQIYQARTAQELIDKLNT